MSTLFSDGENIDPSGSQARTVDLAPGTYLFVCNIPGHFKNGMFTVGDGHQVGSVRSGLLWTSRRKTAAR